MDRKQFIDQLLHTGRQGAKLVSQTPARVKSGVAAGAAYGLGKVPTEQSVVSKEIKSYPELYHQCFADSVRGTNVVKKDERLNRKRPGLTKQNQMPIIKHRLEREDIGKYIATQFEQSDLAPLLKDLGPYIVRQESKGSRTIESPVGAKGLWQFMPATAKQCKLRDRENPHQSTRAAILYLNKIYHEIEACSGYHKLRDIITEEGYHNSTDLLSLLTINAYNGGPGHMTNALSILAQNPNTARKYIKRREGELGVFEWITSEYADGYKKYQTSSPYYHHESSSYVYEIMQRYLTDTGKTQSTPDTTPRQKIVSIEKDIALALAAGGLGVAAASQYIDTMQTRRKQLHDMWDGARIGIGLYGTAKLGLIKQPADTIKETIDIKKDQTLLLSESEIYAESDKLEIIKDIYFELVKNKTYDKENRRILHKDVKYMIETEYYIMDQHIADLAYEQYKLSHDKKYLQISYTFYRKALKESQQQLDRSHKKLKLPHGGIPEVEERISYCQNAIAQLELEN